MMVRKCDRCGKRINDVDYVRIEAYLRPESYFAEREAVQISSLDLCRECDREFHQRFLQEVKTNAKQA